jgi:cytochrome c biogenesis protein CcmG/thiol:disulfide interchange protein DsbE
MRLSSGSAYPPFPDLQGKRVSSTTLVGKPVVLNLWFTSCAPCRAEMPTLNRIQAEKATTDVVFLALTYEPAQQVRAFLRQQAFTFRQLPEAKQYFAQFTTDYPISIFVDRNGIIQTIIEGLPQRYDRVTKQLTATVDDTAFYAALKQIE